MLDDEILQILRKSPNTFFSGEEISHCLKVSRTAVWKRIARLRAMGYAIEASTRLGYRLIQSPDLLIPLEVEPLLKTQWMGKTLHHFQTLDSTNSKAYELAFHGAEEGEVVITESQTKGRGRLERSWYSPPFLNLYLSVILRPKIPPQQASLLTLLAAIATADAIKQVSGLSPLIKWPNDVLLRDRKVAGLLNEIHSEMDRIHFVILGIGVNLNMEEKDFPKEIQSTATSLRMEIGRPISRKEFLQSLLSELEAWYTIFIKQGGQIILNAWRERAQIKGREVRVSSFGETLLGRAVDIDSDGALILETENGSQRRVLAGDLEYSEKSKS